MMPVNLLSLATQEFKEFIDSFDHVFSDCDGVLWMKDALPGVGEFVRLMKQYGKTVHFISNNSMRSKEKYEALFEDAGIRNGFENLTVPSAAIAEFLKSINFDKHVYCVTCPEGQRILESHGIKCKNGPDMGLDDFDDYHCYLEDDPDIGAVVFDSDFKANMPKLYKAETYLKRPEVLFINGPTDRSIPFGNSGYAVGLAVFPEIVSQVTNRTPIGLGKPSKLYGEFAMKRAGYTDPSRVLFIGDMIDQDVCLGKNVGFITLLVLSHFDEEEVLASKIQPDFYATSLGSLVPILKELGKN